MSSHIIKYYTGEGAAIAALLLLLGAMTASCASADTIHMKDGRELKGIVVEEYKDRLLVSTVDGEVTMMKSEIKELYFDEEETNLIKLGDQARDAKRYMKAAAYYGGALKLNPDSKGAKDGLLYLQLHISDKIDSMRSDSVRRQRDIDENGGSILVEKSDDEALKEVQSDLSKSLGLKLCADGFMPFICLVRPDSPAEMAGMIKGDTLVAIWGRLTGYMTLREVADHLLKKASPEIRCTIERTRDVKVNKSKNIFSGPQDSIGADLTIGFDGLTIEKARRGGNISAAGLADGDIIVAIDGVSTRYMAMSKVTGIICGSVGSVRLTFRRDLIIWKRD